MFKLVPISVLNHLGGFPTVKIRGKDTALHRVMGNIRKVLELVLLWPSVDGDEGMYCNWMMLL